MNECTCLGGPIDGHHSYICPRNPNNTPTLKHWERDLLTDVPTPTAVATFHLQDGTTLVMHDVRVDSIGPSGVHPGVVGVEFNSGDMDIAHIPFVRYWTIDYI